MRQDPTFGNVQRSRPSARAECARQGALRENSCSSSFLYSVVLTYPFFAKTKTAVGVVPVRIQRQFYSPRRVLLLKQ